jgi:long-chain acyl-CoA synthetase
MLSQDNLISNAEDVVCVNNPTGSDTVCPIIPLSHMFSWVTGIFTPTFTKSRVILPDAIDLKRIDLLSDNLHTHSVNYLYTIPIVLYLMAKQKDSIQYFTFIKGIISGGYKLTPMIYNSYKRKFSIDILEGYGLTEASPICTWHRPGDTIKPGSVGRNFPSVQIKIVDNNQNDLNLNSTGEICVRGKNVMEGYYSKPGINKRIICNGWLKTGDLGYLDNDNYLFLTGLKKRMYNVGGRNVYHEEIIRYLKMNNNVEHVELNAHHNVLTGHKIEASVSLKRNSVEEQNLFIKWCVDNISNFKLPKIWKFV